MTENITGIAVGDARAKKNKLIKKQKLINSYIYTEDYLLKVLKDLIENYM